MSRKVILDQTLFFLSYGKIIIEMLQYIGVDITMFNKQLFIKQY